MAAAAAEQDVDALDDMSNQQLVDAMLRAKNERRRAETAHVLVDSALDRRGVRAVAVSVVEHRTHHAMLVAHHRLERRLDPAQPARARLARAGRLDDHRPIRRIAQLHHLVNRRLGQLVGGGGGEAVLH